MKATLVDFGKDSFVYNITDTTKEELDNKLNLFFAAENLPFKSETGEDRAYQRGNKTLRVLLGVFVKYFRVLVTIRRQNELFSVRLQRDMNLLLSGGAIGIVKSRKEFTRISEAFKVYFNQ